MPRLTKPVNPQLFINIGLISIALVYVLTSTSPGKHRLIGKKNNPPPQHNSPVLDCSPKVNNIEDDSLVASASKETVANPCLFAGCSVIF